MGKSKKNTDLKRQHQTAVNYDVDESTPDDPRFAAALSRPHFRKQAKADSKVVLDERFASVLTDPRFQLQEKDRYGRKRKQKENAKEELSAFYTIEDKNEEPLQDDNEKIDGKHLESSQPSFDEKHEDDGLEIEKEDPASRIAYLTALSRGELEVSSSSDDDDDDDLVSVSTDDELDNTRVSDVQDPQSKEEEVVEMTYEPSPYLAVLNLDWEHVRAVDIFAVMSSFTPPGAVRRVQVYPSDFGMEQMAKEEKFGPTDIWKKDMGGTDNSDNDEDPEEDLSDDKNDPVNPDFDNTAPESDFDAEKLRAYEISKLKYYFAVVEFSSPEYANIAYKELDGQELEHSSAEMDLRAIPTSDFDGVVQNRKLRDEATAIPGNYRPPDFVVNALQQTSVQCTWEDGDVDREKALTKYSTDKVGTWNELAEQDDLRAYLASDQSSDDDSRAERKAASKRSMLGLDSDDDALDSPAEFDHNPSSSNSSDESSEDENAVNTKEVKFFPGSKKLEEKIRNKIQSKDDEKDELTPWQKYQEKRKQKRKERKQAARNARKESIGTTNENLESERPERDKFFVDDSVEAREHQQGSQQGRETIGNDNGVQRDPTNGDDELELLLAGEGDEEDERDFDLRGLQRMEKNKDKKLRGTRKRKELAATADVAGKDFKVDVKDDRFAAVMDGADSRFGIDRTDPNFKETPAMREILNEQMKRRKNKKAKQVVAPDTNADSSAAKLGDKSSGATALTLLVKNLKSRVS